MPGDAAATVDLDDRRPVGRTFEVLSAAARGVDGRMFEQQTRIGNLAGDPAGVHVALKRPCLRIREQPQMLEREITHAVETTRSYESTSFVVNLLYASAPKTAM
ncbi:MAG: hypothetical protein QOG69_2690 [Actinomycetota bacterium]|nr:hypothetical protein [Actinomycetota bacterium]